MLALWKGLLPRLLTKGLGSLIWYTSYMEARRWVAHMCADEPVEHTYMRAPVRRRPSESQGVLDAVE